MTKTFDYTHWGGRDRIQNIEATVDEILSNSFPAGAPGLSGAQYVSLVGANLTTGDHDLYTVPTGKKAFISPILTVYNNSVGAIACFSELKVGATYYRLSSAANPASGISANANMQSGIVLNAGETFAVNVATTNGLNCRGLAWEFDATDSRLVTGRNLALASGDNTLYTVPVGKNAVVVSGLLGSVTNALNGVVVNNSGGSLNYYWNVVPSGGTTDTTNIISTTTSVADKVCQQFTLSSSLTAGESISVHSSGVDAGGHQIAWVTVYQIP